MDFSPKRTEIFGYHIYFLMQVDQQLDSAQQLLAQRRSNSPPQSRPYPVRPKNRVNNLILEFKNAKTASTY